ncbi:guanylate kinase [Propionibacterium australiense]|uniref:Guanylate kinase n=1 Tax=Propionibacterium australiense TaxID=119981 RepID=A0A383S2U2_9ACTN|nr:guanylate kinase [Propionibacterium australiense]RLP11545.1 guanylate kinase [Propionibacterium australiense]RLP12721.1 guanylate kinase [Propionibacterium australiense]SYZ32257.1 guanylate kinase [Propionibacterium australiense]VEH90571.1 Guanylate kinase [Propionibacterium australiense]
MGETRPAVRCDSSDAQGGSIGASRPGVFVISGPTAVGKGTVCNRLKVLYPEIFVSVSATTRPPRPGELDGVAYWFVTNDEFDRMIADDGLLEWAIVHGAHRYGTPRRPVEEAVAAGRTVILEIDLQGARQVRTTCPQATHIFLAPPSWDELVRRLQARGTETSEQQERRLRTAARELEATSEFDEIVVNGELDPTVHKLVELMRL